jgi:hypothetical protein
MQGRMGAYEQVLDHMQNDVIPDEHTSLPGDDRWYFPSYDVQLGPWTTMATWSRNLNVSLPRVDWITFVMEKDEETSEACVVHFLKLLDLLGDRVTWSQDRAFVRAEDFPPREWLEGNHFDLPAWLKAKFGRPEAS